MKKLTFLFLLCVLTLSAFSQNLVLINQTKENKIEDYFGQRNFVVNYFNDDFIIGNGIPETKFNYVVIDVFDSQKEYFLIWLDENKSSNYIVEISQFSNILYADNQKLIVKLEKQYVKKLYPIVHGGLVRIQNKSVSLPKNTDLVKNLNYKGIAVIEEMVAQVDTLDIMSNIQHLQDYTTRKYNTPQAIEAQNWIKSEFENLGYTVELTTTGTEGSKNVIATKIGSVYTDQYVVVGGHYDAITYTSLAPGADDNASGTCAVLEIARILQNYDFNRTIIFCAFSAEEIGLYGSGAWASEAANNNMNIVGYLNLDMIGYLHPGDNFHTDIIAPSSAQPLIDLYQNVVAEYVTDFQTGMGNLVGGDSDHTSFNENGYMGIFPFEDGENYSPEIHTENDIIGPSVNSAEQVVKFTQAGVATVAVMAEPFNGLFPPVNLTLQQFENRIELSWNQPSTKNFVKYNVYKNDELYASIFEIDETTYTDFSIVNGETYEYYVTAVYSGELTGESYPSNTVSTTIGLMEIYSWDFEDGTQNWTILNTTVGWKWGLTVDLTGNDTEYLGIDSDTYGNGTHVFDYAISPVLDLSNKTAITLNFDYGYKKYTTDFLKVVYRLSSTSQWNVLAILPTSNNFTTFSIELPEEMYVDGVQIAFYYDDNNVWAWYAGIDNVNIWATLLDENILNPPVSLNYSTTESEVILNWSAPEVKSLIGYNIYKNGSLIETIENPSTLTFTDNDVVINQTYTYYVTANYNEGESSPSNQITVNFGVGIENIEVTSFNVSPNPAYNFIKLDFENQTNSDYTIEIYSLDGKQYSFEKSNNNKIDISNLPAGIYMINLKSEKYNLVNKFIKF